MRKHDIEALERALERGDLDEVADDDVRKLAALATAIQASAAPAQLRHPDVLREKLLAAAASPPPSLLARMRDGFASSTRTVRYSFRAAASSGVAALALTTGGMAVATERSVPGDTFYGVKTMLSDLRVDRAEEGAPRGYALLGSAESRIDEAEDALERRPTGAAIALEMANADARSAAGLLIRAYQETDLTAHTDALAAFTQANRPRVVAIGEELDDPAVDDLLVVFDRIDARLEVILGGGGCCDGNGASGPGAPPAGGFQFDDIPDADQPFEACPCPPGGEQSSRPSSPATGSGTTVAPAPPSPPPPQQSGPSETASGSAPAPSSPSSPAGSSDSQEPAPSPGTSQPAPSNPEPDPEEEQGAVSGAVGEATDPVGAVVEEVIEASPAPEPVKEAAGEAAGTTGKAIEEVTETIDEVIDGLLP